MSISIRKRQVNRQTFEKSSRFVSFVDISEIVDNELSNDSENSEEEEDPLCLDSLIKVDINKNCNVSEESSDSADCCDPDILVLTPVKTSATSCKIDKKIFVCNDCKKRIPNLRFPNCTEIDHPYSKLNSFLDKEEIEPCDKKYKCDFCCSVFITPKVYLIHLATKHKPALRECTFCPQRKPVIHYLRPHKKFYEKCYCSICQKKLVPDKYFSHISKCRIIMKNSFARLHQCIMKSNTSL